MSNEIEGKEWTKQEIAEKFRRDASTVQRWIDAGKFPGARHVEAPGNGYWLVPDSAVKSFKPARRGPKKKSAKAIL